METTCRCLVTQNDLQPHWLKPMRLFLLPPTSYPNYILILTSIMKTSLIIPAYNEDKRLGAFLDSISDYNKQHPNDIQEILVVDDGSQDKTFDVAIKFAGDLPIRIIKHKHNKGKGAAVKTGVMSATADYIVFIDADGATPITELPKMLSALSEAQIGIGNRWLPGSQTERSSFLRKLSGYTYRQYMGLFGLGKIDTMCGFKGYHRDVAKSLFSHLLEQRWLFDTEIAYKAVDAKYTIKNFPIKWRSMDGSKLSTATLITSGLKIWPLIRRIKSHLSIHTSSST
jgi:dolichyl-phosphate beta-glucosyltransferase